MRGSMIVRAVAALTVVMVAVDGGGFGVVSRGTLAIAVWWALLVLVATGLLAPSRLPPAAGLALGFLAAFVVLTGASLAWADSSERAFAELDRAALYLGVFALAALVAAAGEPRAAADGLAVGIAAVAGIALAARFFPDQAPATELPSFLPSAQTRLSYPIGYWNGLAALIAVGVPLLLRSAIEAGSPVRRALAMASLPALAQVLYLTSSRGGTAAALAAVATLLALAPRRLALLGAILTAGAGTALAIWILVARTSLVDGPLGTAAAEAEGRSAALLTLAVCAVTGLGYLLAVRYVPAPPRLPRASVRAGVALLLAAAAVAVIAADPVDAFETFKRPPAPAPATGSGPDPLATHLLSGGGGGRWQFWSAAVDEFRSSPLVGRGAGSFEAWWAQHGTIPYFVRDAHSLYLETLGELGIAGLGLLLGAFAAAAFAALRGWRRRPEADRILVAALLAGFVAFALEAAVDWVWEVTVVAAAGIACLGLAAASASRRPRAVPVLARAAVAVTALAVIAAQALVLLAEIELRDSRAAARAGDFPAALAHALDARALEPWAATPRLQLALVAEETGDLASARGHIGAALERDSRDWRLWLVAARLETKAGAIAAARRSLARARELNPRSPLFAKEEA
jgi:hypothetical protein